MRRDDAVNFVEGVVATVPFDEDDLLVGRKPWQALDRGRDVAALVPARDDDACRQLAGRRLTQRAEHHVVSDTQTPDQRQRSDESVDGPGKAEPSLRHQLTPFAFDLL